MSGEESAEPRRSAAPDPLTPLRFQMDGVSEGIRDIRDRVLNERLTGKKDDVTIEAGGAPITQNGGGPQLLAHQTTHEHSKLLPWLMLTAVLAGTALGVSVCIGYDNSHTEQRMRDETDRQYRFLQELRVRVEDAEMAAKEVNPQFRTPRQPKEH